MTALDSMGARTCPQCQATYAGDVDVCPRDGAPLSVAASTPAEEAAFAVTAFGVGTPMPDAPQPVPTPIVVTPVQTEEPDRFVGRTIGLYKVIRRIGQGGMGTVYHVEHVHLGKPFAMKVLTSEIAKHATAIDRLKQEAVAASKIDHDNIVSVVSFDRTDDGDVYIVMELLKGQDLADALAPGPLPLERAVPIAMQIASALAAAHEAGIVHRDLKPENVFLVRRGERELVKVLDFGISKVKSADAEQVRMTKTGQLVGTPLYMSPEQAKGEADVDHRVDVYALGVILYEMLAGETPFSGGNYFQLLWKHGNEPAPALRPKAPHVTDAIEAVVQKALAKKREDRFDSMLSFEIALGTAAPGLTVSLMPGMSLTSLPPSRGSTPIPATEVTPQLTQRRSRLPLWIGAGVVLLLGGTALAIGTGGTPSGNHSTPELSTGDPGGSDPSHGTGRPDPGHSNPSHVDPDPSHSDPSHSDPSHDPSFDPHDPSVVVHVTSVPLGADVTRDGVQIGTTPCDVRLPPGDDVQLRLLHRGFVPATVQVTPAEGATAQATLHRIHAGHPEGDGTGLPIKGTF